MAAGVPPPILPLNCTVSEFPSPKKEARHLGRSKMVKCLIAALYAALVAWSLWFRHGLAQEGREALDRAESWDLVARRSSELSRELTAIYATTIQESADARDFQSGRVSRAAFNRAFLEFRVEAENRATLSEAGKVSGCLEEMESRVADFFKQVEPPANLAEADAVAEPSAQLKNEARWFIAASEASEKVRAVVLAIALQRAQTQLQAAQQIEFCDYGLAGLLLMSVAGTTLFLYRLARTIRDELFEKAHLEGRLSETDSKYRLIFDNAIEGIFQTTPDGRFITVNESLSRMYGYLSPAHLIESISDIATQLYVDPARHQALLESLSEDGVVSSFELEVLRADGQLMWVRENVRAVRNPSGTLLYLQGTVEDISNRRWSEQRRRLQYATTRILNEVATVAAARPKVLQLVCETLEWDLGAVWAVDAEGGLLRCMEIWHRPNLDVTEFELANCRTNCTATRGLAEEVWVEGEVRWVYNLREELDYPNAAIALDMGMNSAFGIPIWVGGEVRYVFEFFSPKTSLSDPDLLQTLAGIGTQLGHLVERKASEQALRKSDLRKAAILQSALDSIVSFDANGKITEFNPAAEAMFGYTQSEVLGREMVELIIPYAAANQSPRGIDLYNTSAASGVSFGRRMELVAMRRDGVELPVEIAVSRIFVDGMPVFTAYLRDITDRKEAGRIAFELAAVVANSNDAIIGCHLNGVIRSWNAAAERIYGYSEAEALGQALQMLLPPECFEELEDSLVAVKNGGSVAAYETTRLCKGGRKIAVSLTVSPIRSESGKISGAASIARDITEHKRLEEELLQSQKMEAVGRLAGGIAHDFNNILTAILGYSDLIISQVDERQWMHKHLVEIRKAAEFAASLTHQLLAFSRRQPLDPKVFNINDSVRNMQKMLERVIGEQVKIETLFLATKGCLKADQGQLEQVLLNLCVNARDAMPKGGTIMIQTDDVIYSHESTYVVNEMPVGEYVKLSLTDTGTGMPPEVMTHIFEPFFTTKESGQGTGLGLATCYGIVKQSGGYIVVESESGVGTTFSIYLPQAAAQGETGAVKRLRESLPGGKETILYVEDELTVRQLTTHVLRRLGYTVYEAGDAMQARQIMEEQLPTGIDLFFCDVVLPDVGGHELSGWIQSRSAATKHATWGGTPPPPNAAPAPPAELPDELLRKRTRA